MTTFAIILSSFAAGYVIALLVRPSDELEKRAYSRGLMQGLAGWAQPRDTPDIKLGNTVRKKRGYPWPGVIVADFRNLAGERRIVVECTVPEVQGALHIYNPEQLENISE